jgi:flagellar assembly protein FliH
MAKLYKDVTVSQETVRLYEKEALLIDTPEPSFNAIHMQEIQDTSYQEGYLAGKEEITCLTETQMGLLKNQLEGLLFSIPDVISQSRLALQSEIADMVWLIIQPFFIEKTANRQAIELQINQILSQINSKQTVELCLHPNDIAALQNGDIRIDAAHLNGLKIKSDESLTLGGCLIKTEHGVFNASIEKQVDKLKEVLLHIKQGRPYESLA